MFDTKVLLKMKDQIDFARQKAFFKNYDFRNCRHTATIFYMDIHGDILFRCLECKLKGDMYLLYYKMIH